jgi:hypothetical protein
MTVPLGELNGASENFRGRGRLAVHQNPERAREPIVARSSGNEERTVGSAAQHGDRGILGEETSDQGR